jgi:hypothetical protein
MAAAVVLVVVSVCAIKADVIFAAATSIVFVVGVAVRVVLVEDVFVVVVVVITVRTGRTCG